jgi:putative sterol carrier protein
MSKFQDRVQKLQVEQELKFNVKYGDGLMTEEEAIVKVEAHAKRMELILAEEDESWVDITTGKKVNIHALEMGI